jgi:hypothetical protein
MSWDIFVQDLPAGFPPSSKFPPILSRVHWAAVGNHSQAVSAIPRV